MTRPIRMHIYNLCCLTYCWAAPPLPILLHPHHESSCSENKRTKRKFMFYPIRVVIYLY